MKSPRYDTPKPPTFAPIMPPAPADIPKPYMARCRVIRATVQSLVTTVGQCFTECFDAPGYFWPDGFENPDGIYLAFDRANSWIDAGYAEVIGTVAAEETAQYARAQKEIAEKMEHIKTQIRYWQEAQDTLLKITPAPCATSHPPPPAP